jgi:lipopolysaccharide export system protein LptA
MTPDAPVKDFRLPRFGDEGYTQWVLQGAEGIYDSEAQVRVESMAMRVYSGDERMALELSMDSPSATLRLKENRGYSDRSIEIVGANFKISGIGWEWSGETREIIVKEDTMVTFTQGIAGAFGGAAQGGGETDAAKKTEIRSQRLLLRTSEAGYYFEFTGGVVARSDEMDLQSQELFAYADAPEGRTDLGAVTAPGELESIRRIVAREQVVIVQGNKTVRAEEAEFFPREKRANLSGSTSVTTPGAYLSGETIRSRSGEIVLSGAEGKGRAQTILSDAGGLGLQGASALNTETIVLADAITMREQPTENHFLFDGSVEVLSGAVQLQSSRMKIVSSRVDASADDTSELKVGEVIDIMADGGVRIEQEGQIATGERVTFYPKDERAVLEGDPRVSNGEAVLTGHRMELKPKRALIEGIEGVPAVVRLPPMPDLGYEAFAPSLAPGSSAPEPTVEIEEEATVVSSLRLVMTEAPEQTTFSFTDQVTVAATNLDATCDRLDVVTRQSTLADVADQGSLELQRIEAYDKVVIKQAGRTATADKADILPIEGQVILEGQAVVEDERGKVSGHRMTLLQGQRRAIVEGGGPDGERARVTLPSMSE